MTSTADGARAGGGGGAPVGASATRASRVGLFAAFAALLLVLSATPLILSPPVGLVLEGSSYVPTGRDATFTGRFTLASFGLASASVDVFLDGAFLERVTTGPDGAFEVDVRIDARGPHVLAATAAPGAYTEASTGDLPFRVVDAPRAPSDLRASPGAGGEVALAWRAPVADDDRPVQTYRIYRQSATAPWIEVATAPGGATSASVAGAAGDWFAVAAANVAGESAWSAPAST